MAIMKRWRFSWVALCLGAVAQAAVMLLGMLVIQTLREGLDADMMWRWYAMDIVDYAAGWAFLTAVGLVPSGLAVLAADRWLGRVEEEFALPIAWGFAWAGLFWFLPILLRATSDGDAVESLIYHLAYRVTWATLVVSAAAGVIGGFAYQRIAVTRFPRLRRRVANG